MRIITRKHDDPRARAGTTMIEAIVLLALITIVSAVVLASFSGQNEGVALNRASRELILRIREAQHTALAARELRDPVTQAIRGVPPRMGIQFAQGTGGYFLFADYDNNFKYSPPAAGGTDLLMQTVPFERSIVVSEFNRENHTAISLPAGVLNIFFSAPEATATFNDINGVDIGTAEPYLSLKLLTPGGKIKEVAIRTSGQITAP